MSRDAKNGLKGDPLNAAALPAVQGPDHSSDNTVDQSVRNHLGRKLRATYDDLVQQAVPNKFLQLLDELERKEKKQ